jgi:hypothetical protein
VLILHMANRCLVIASNSFLLWIFLQFLKFCLDNKMSVSQSLVNAWLNSVSLLTFFIGKVFATVCFC